MKHTSVLYALGFSLAGLIIQTPLTQCQDIALGMRETHVMDQKRPFLDDGEPNPASRMAKIVKRGSSSPEPTLHERAPKVIKIFICPNKDARSGGQKRAEFQDRLKDFDIDEEDGTGMNSEYECYFHTLKNQKLQDFDEEFNNGKNLAECVERKPNAIPLAESVDSSLHRRDDGTEFNGAPGRNSQTFRPVRQKNAPEDLPFFSQDPKKTRNDYKLNGQWQYVHYSNAGRQDPTTATNRPTGHTAEFMGVRTYLIDTGVNPKHSEFSHFDKFAEKVEWIIPGDKDDRKTAEQSIRNGHGDPHGHGTCMLSKICGRTLGVSKLVYPVVARVPMLQDDNHNWAGFEGDLLIQAMEKVTEDWEKFKVKAKAATTVEPRVAVVSMSFDGAPDLEMNAGSENLYKRGIYNSWTLPQEKKMVKVMEKGAKAGLYYVAASGNDGKLRIQKWPAALKFGSSSGFHPGFPIVPTIPMFLVGAVDNDGELADFSNTHKDVEMLFAPGKQIECARHDSDTSTQKVDGTSPATASTAGLLSNLLALPESLLPSDTKYNFDKFHDLVYKTAYVRKNAGQEAEAPPQVTLKGVYNGIQHPGDLAKVWKAEYKRNGQADPVTYTFGDGSK